MYRRVRHISADHEYGNPQRDAWCRNAFIIAADGAARYN